MKLAAPSFRSKRGRSVAIRSAGPGDAPAIATMIGSLSPHTVQRRYFTSRALTGEAACREAERLTRADVGLIVLVVCAEGDPAQVVAVAELRRDRAEPAVAEGAVVVADAYQGEGIGRAVVERLAEAAASARITRVRATINAYNMPMRRLIASFGRPYSASFAGGDVQYELRL